jgi:hypothetical protein
MGMACSTDGKMRVADSILVGKPEGKRPLERPRLRWEDNIRVGDCGLNASGSGQVQMEGYCEYDNEPSVPIKGGEFLDYSSDC